MSCVGRSNLLKQLFDMKTLSILFHYSAECSAFLYRIQHLITLLLNDRFWKESFMGCLKCFHSYIYLKLQMHLFYNLVIRQMEWEHFGEK